MDPAKAAAEIERRRRTRRLALYRPYPCQFEFHKAGATFRERLLMKGNQVGGTTAGAMEIAFHLTGLYPDWWPGARFNRPILAWCGSESNETSKEVIQFQLLGTEEAQWGHPDFGTGSIPREKIKRFTTRQAGIKGVVDTIQVNHISGGVSRCVLKTYEQGVAKWYGKKVDVVWPDEEPMHEDKIYSEGLTRTQASEGGMIFMTFSPLKGMTKLVDAFMNPKPGDSPKSVTTMTTYDAVGGIWPEGTPWAGQPWQGHYTKEQVDAIIAAYPSWERKTRAYGVPMAGEGLVWQVDEETIKIAPFKFPNHYRHINGLDFGIGHPFGFVALALDPETDTLYLYNCWKAADQLPPTHCEVIRRNGDWIPTAWPHDGKNRDKGSGLELHNLYRRPGVRLLPYSARYEDDKGGPQGVEPAVLDIYERMVEGRFKVFAHLEDWFKEFRNYHRKDGVIVRHNDDLMSATLYAKMELRSALPKMRIAAHRRPQRPMMQQWG